MQPVILVGADPELFVRDNTGTIVSGYDLIPGTKETPYPVKRGAVQVDGMALEFNIDPAKNSKEFCENIQEVLTQLARMVPDYSLVTESVAEFSEEYMKAQPFEATRLGCDPDFNAYTLSQNPTPDGTRNFRTAAGHIHVGFTDSADINDPSHMADCAAVAKQLDVLLGVPSVLFDNSANASKRRELYGKAGAFRPKRYGMEYRTLSNKWLSSPTLTQFVYDKTVDAVKRLFAGEFLFEKILNAELIINNSETQQAKNVCKELGIQMV